MLDKKWIRSTNAKESVPLGTLIAPLFNFTFNPPTGGGCSLFLLWPSDWAPLTSCRSSGSITVGLYPFVSGGRSPSLCSCYNNACKLCLVPPAAPHRSPSRGSKLHPENGISAKGRSFNHWQSIVNDSSLSGGRLQSAIGVPGCLCSRRANWTSLWCPERTVWWRRCSRLMPSLAVTPLITKTWPHLWDETN